MVIRGVTMLLLTTNIGAHPCEGKGSPFEESDIRR